MTEEAHKDDRGGQVLRMRFKLDFQEALRPLKMLDRRLFCCAELNEAPAVSQDCTRGSDETPRSDDKRHRGFGDWKGRSREILPCDLAE